MKTEEIVEAVRSAGFSSSEMLHRLAEFKRLIQYSTSAEREKCTGTQEFVTLPREVVEQALEALINEGEFRKLLKPLIEKSIDSIRAALDQPKNHIEHHLGMVPAGWKLVPVDPTDDMLYDIQEFSHILPPRGKRIWAHMLAAAPQPPTVKESLTVEQPQVEQPAMTPIAQRKLDSLITEGYTISGYSVYHERKHQHGFVTGAGLVGWWKPDGMEYPQPQGEQKPMAWLTIEVMGPRTKVDVEWEDQLQKLPSGIYKLYTNPQPKREPLPDHYINGMFSAASLAEGDMFRRFARDIEAAHNIK